MIVFLVVMTVLLFASLVVMVSQYTKLEKEKDKYASVLVQNGQKLAELNSKAKFFQEEYRLIDEELAKTRGKLEAARKRLYKLKKKGHGKI